MTIFASRPPGRVFLWSALLLGAVHASAADTQRPPTAASPLTALDRYVATPDAALAWELERSQSLDGGTADFIALTSQEWRTSAEVSQPRWRHWLTIIRPDNVRHTTALLVIAGGQNNDNRPPRASGQLLAIARHTGSIVVELRMVPNQPLAFGRDGVARYEDDIIAATWDRFLRTDDPHWPVQLPMTKAAVRAMDTVTAFCASEAGGRTAVHDFVVTGGSKRGWTTWLTAAVDRRVRAIAPLVIDMLNMEESMLHHYQAYGFWSPAVHDYVAHGIMDWMHTAELRALQQLVDPFAYRDRLTMPKLMLNAAGDQFFLPDSSQFYFAELRGPKFLRYVPNADHSLRETDAYDTLLAWHHAMLHDRALPQFEWEHAAPGVVRLRVPAADRPREIRLWQATHPTGRDFRLETIGPAWTATMLKSSADGSCEARVETPADGWTAYFVELTFDLGAPTPLKLTTDVRVIPERLPFDPPASPRTP